MSTFSVPVVRLAKVGKHPNADTLSITQVEGCPVIFRTGDFVPGDLAVYVPVDAIVPEGTAGLEFLKFKSGVSRIRAMKLRGIFSMGVLIKPPDGVEPGQNLAVAMGIVKYEEPEPIGMNTGNERDPGFMPVYDMESYRKYKHLLVPGEVVYVTEKIHGANARFAFREGRLWVGSHRTVKAENDANMWWRVAKDQGLAEKLERLGSKYVLYGEVFGSVQDLKYGTKAGEFRFAAFDLYDIEAGRFVDAGKFTDLVDEVGIPRVPPLYWGSYLPEVVEPLADGASTLANHIREGIVIKPSVERWNFETGRTCLKLVSEAYLLRRGGTEHH